MSGNKRRTYALTEIVKVVVRIFQQFVDHSMTVGARKPRPDNVARVLFESDAPSGEVYRVLFVQFIFKSQLASCHRDGDRSH